MNAAVRNGPKRAITLAGGGPAAGLHIGALKRLEEAGIEFDVWALSCIGAWVGIVYNTRLGDHKGEQTEEFFLDGVFRDDASYDRFPINRAFGPDVGRYAWAWADFLANPDNYRNLVLPDRIAQAASDTLAFIGDPQRWLREGDRNAWILNQVLAVNPISRFLTSLLYLSQVNGLSRIYYRDSTFLDELHIGRLRAVKADIYHNAWDLTHRQIQLFHNKGQHGFVHISKESLCACSALPYVEETVTIGDTEYCEGALVETVNFRDILELHPDLDEIWVSRIVDIKQVRKPGNVAEGLANLCMLFPGSLGEDDVKLFRELLRKRRKFKPRVIEIPVDHHIDFQWNHSNLRRGIADGYDAVDRLLGQHPELLH